MGEYGLDVVAASGQAVLPGLDEQGLDGLVASAEAVLPGLGPLVGGLAGLVVDAGRGETLDAVELVAGGPRGRELLCGVVQLSLDRQAAAEVRVPAVTGADGVRRARAERGHARTVVTTLGEVVVRRIGYRAGVKGAGALFPRDGVLNLPPRRYSWQLQQLVVMCVRGGAYELAGELVAAVTGVVVGKRQLEEIAAAAAADVPGFYDVCPPGGPGQAAEPGGRAPGQPGGEQPVPPPARPPQPDGAAGGEPAREAMPPLVLSADGKGVAMLPQSRRERTRAPGERVRNFATRPGIGEKGHKRIAEVACVHDVIPEPRTPEQVMASHHGQDAQGQAAAKAGKKPAPKAVSRRYRVDIAADRAETIGWLFDEAQARDPGHAQDWLALVDGDNYQIARIEAEAAERGVTGITILIDLIHVLEYLWKAAWALHPPRDPAIETWTTAQALDILHGRTADVTARIARLAAAHPPQGSEHARNITRALSYLEAKQPCLDYPRALAAGWPVATGVIEGACRHLVKDRMAITGARWSTQGAQAILWLRVIHANRDHDAYWTHHLQQEHQRNHQNRYQNDLDLAA